MDDVGRCVTGHLKPLSVLINGSIDVDNLDNVGRYWFTARNGEFLFDAQAIASSFRYDEAKPLFPGQWHLSQSCLKEAKRWQKARKAVYEIIYGEPNLGARIMVYRAVEIAFHRGQLTEDFFHLNDVQAMDFLLTCNRASMHVAQKFLAQQIYPELIAFKTTRPSLRLKVISEDRDMRKAMAETICKECGLPQSAACVYIGQGRDKRKIDLPFLGRNGSKYLDNGNYHPIYRVKVYVDPEFENKKMVIGSLVKQMTE